MDNKNKAIAKITEEAMALKNETATRIEEYITEHITEENAENILNKTFKGCLAHIRDEAKKMAKNGMAMIEDEDVYRWAREFYGIEKKEGQANAINLLDFI